MHCAEDGFLYTCGDGLHGKLALGDDNISNHFKPTLVTRFAQFFVQSVRNRRLVTRLLRICCDLSAVYNEAQTDESYITNLCVCMWLGFMRWLSYAGDCPAKDGAIENIAR